MINWTFQIGSCAMKAFPFYLYSFQIFSVMENRPADFMIWTGDHVYMLKPWQWSSKDAMVKVYTNQRETPKLKSFMASRPQYAIWDDHDYGPNNSGAEFFNKDTSLQVFKEMWPHQPQADTNEGIYFTFKHNDAQFFMLDVRFFKVPGTQLLGKKQMEWLCQELKNSTAPFKFICSGIQVICDGNYENFRKFPEEFDFFMKYLSKEKIDGVVFFSGDTHFSEASKVDRINEYPLYDFTFSPLTSFPVNYFSVNKNGIDGTKHYTYNFGEITFSGDTSNRNCFVRCINKNGKELWNFRLNENDLKYK